MTTAATKSSRATRASDSYLACIHRFPIRPLRTNADYREATEVLGSLATRTKLDAGEQDYLEGLAHFVGEYERKSKSSPLQGLNPLEALQFLMDQNDMTTTDLGRILGSRGLASEVLNGKRGLSKTMIHRLAERFAVEPALFLD